MEKPTVGTLVSKAKGKNRRRYWYYVESARVDGEPRIVRQDYLGSAEKVARAVNNGISPVPASATARAWGLPGALWLAARDSGVWDCLCELWPLPRRHAPGLPHYLLLAAIQRICKPGPKTEVQQWYAHTVLSSIWKFSPKRFTSQAFWDAFTRVKLALPFPENDLDRAQLQIARLWRQQHLVGDSILAYDATNFYTYIDSKNEHCTLAQRGRNKQKRHDLKQVGLAYAMDGASGLGLFHHTYPGNRPDVEEFSVSLPRITELLERIDIPRSQITLVFDKGGIDLANALELDRTGMGWIAAVPWSQVPPEVASMPADRLRPCSHRLPGIRACALDELVYGRDRRCVLQHSSVFEAEQLHSLMNDVAKACGKLRALAREAADPHRRRRSRSQLDKRIAGILAGQWLKDIIGVNTQPLSEDQWAIQFSVDNAALSHLINHRLGRTLLVTSRPEWTPERVVVAYHDQGLIERQFRSLKDGEGCSWGPMFVWTDDKIKVHSFYCMLGLSLLNWLHLRSSRANLALSMEQMIHQLAGLQEIVLIYPAPNTPGPNPTSKVDTRETLDQIQLIKLFGLERLHGRTGRG